jgi:Tfp pilus assembly protein FimT
MKLQQKQKGMPTVVKVGLALSLTGVIVFGIIFFSGLFSSENSKAIPPNATTFSETCFSIADGGADLFEFNKYTGGPINNGNTAIGSPEASTLNLFGDTLFVIDGSAGEFGYVDLSSAQYTILNSDYESTQLNGVDGKVTFGDIDAMTVDNDDVLWVAHRDNNDTDPSYIAKMNHQGEFILNAFGVGVDYVKFDGPDGFPSVLDAMAYDPIQEILYVCANDGSGNPTYNNLMKIDPETGKGTFVGNFNIGDVEGLGFDGEGNMYATTGTSSQTSSNRNSFFSVNKYTALATKVFTFSSGTDFETCDCVIGYKNTIKGTVFYDVDENGFIGDGESGYGGVTVNLYYDENNNGQYDAGTDGFVRSTTTNAQGEYILYDAYESGTLNYVVTINTANLPTGSTLTTDNVENASFSSGGNVDINNDFGYKLSPSLNNTISGYVYGDDDEDQVFDGGENGVEGVTVYLYKDINGNGVYDLGTDIIVTSKETASDGSYNFTRPYIGGTVQIDLTPGGNRDAHENSSGTVDRTGTSLDFGDKHVGMSFRSATIPAGATIEEAYFEAESNGTYTNQTSIVIYGEDVDDGGVFRTQTNNISGRTQTSASVAWVMPYWNGADIRHQSPDITTIVQEIVDRSGWSSGNDINILTTRTSGLREAKSRNVSANDGPHLFVTYFDEDAEDNYLTFVGTTTLPTGSSLTTDNIETASFSSGGNSDPNNNFGIYQDPSTFNTISGTVFRDGNEDGSYNGANDNGENGVTVCLFNDANANGLYDASDEILQIKKTDVNGFYSFEEEYSDNDIIIQSRVSQSSDDAEGPTSVSTTSSDLDFAQDAVAVRFNNMNIPQGANITEAYIEFTSESTKSGSYSFGIEGIDVDNVTTFTTSQNFNTFNRTSASATWSGSDAWSSDELKTSPMVTSIVQEIVNRSGWTSGNSMGFVFNTGTGDRDAYTYDNDPNKAPNLLISYESSGVNYVVIIKESNLPNGYELTTDNLEVASFNSGGNTDANNDFGYKLNTSGLNQISGYVFSDADQDGEKDGSENGLSSIQIELVADLNCDGDIDAGENVIASTSTNASGFYEFYESFSENISVSVSQSSDDADESTTSITSSDLDFAQSTVAVRFNNLDIPQGANIVTAYIEFTAEANKSGNYAFTVEGVDVDNVSTFSNGQNLNSLARTSASANMSGDENWVAESKYNSPSLTTIVQEIVNRSGWDPTNSMAFIFNTGSGDRDAYSYDNNAGKAPRLVIEYEPSSLCYITRIKSTSFSQEASLTTNSIQTASFNSANNSDPNNDFGLYYAPLPVDLIAFNGTWVGNSVSLKWVTATELNNDYFDVQWSTDGLYFENIGQVKGFGTTLDEVTYNFTHNNPGSENYYRLKQNDFDGAYEYSPIIKLSKEVGEELTLKASPNPFYNELSVQIESPAAIETQLIIKGIDGRAVYSKDISITEGGQNINIFEAANFEPGTYIIMLPLENEVKTFKIIKQ